MWVFCGGMKRSGSTLQFQLAAHLVEMAGLGQRVGWTAEFAEAKQLYGAQPGWKVYKNHNHSPDIAAEFAAGRAKGVYVYRDLRDVFVSFMHKQEAPFERLWQRDILREVVQNHALWTEQAGVLVSRYETMMDDVAGEVARIADHLGIALADGQAQAIADEYSIDRQKARIGSVTDVQALDGRTVFDKHSLLHGNHISEGEGQAGQWRTVLTADQIGLVEARYGAWLVAQGYQLHTTTEE